MMISLLIAEDENIERRYLKKMIEDYYNNQVKIIGEARDGEEAIKKAIINHPDIILMDIHMPCKDGLEAIEIIKSQLPETEIIILTAYSQFEYAKKALQLKVEDYLVKPYSDAKFKEAINQVIDKIDKKTKNSLKQENFKTAVKEFNTVLEKNFIQLILDKTTIDEEKLKVYISNLNISQDYYFCMIISNDKSFEQSDPILIYIKQQLKFYNINVIGATFYDEMVLFLFSDQLHTNILNEVVHTINLNLKKVYSLDVSIGISKQYEKFNDIKESYLEAKNQINAVYKLKVIDSMQTLDVQLLYTAMSSLWKNILSNDLESSNQLIVQFLNNIQIMDDSKRLQLSKDYVKHCCIMIQKEMDDYCHSKMPPTILREICLKIDSVECLEKLYEYFQTHVRKLVLFISQHMEQNTKNLTDSICQYIHENYSKNLSLQEVSDVFSISTFYLSKCFKKVVGVTFKDYIIQIRIEEAKKLMSSTTMNVSEIAYSVGYTDPNYFSKSFKKIVGVSPKKFMNI